MNKLETTTLAKQTIKTLGEGWKNASLYNDVWICQINKENIYLEYDTLNNEWDCYIKEFGGWISAGKEPQDALKQATDVLKERQKQIVNQIEIMKI